MAIYRGARKYAITMGNLEISTGNQNLVGAAAEGGNTIHLLSWEDGET